MARKFVVGLIGLAIVSASAFILVGPSELSAQGSPSDQPDPSEILDALAGANGPMQDMMTNMVRGMLLTSTETLANPVVAERIATFHRQYYDALVAEGFTGEQAMRLVANIGAPIPAMGGG